MRELSIIIPVYNVEKYLKKSVFSVLNQKQEAVEIILVDDGSTDRSGEIADRFQEEFENVRVSHQQNGGSSCARNVGIKLAAGKFILFLDSDDYLVPGSLKNILAIIGRESEADVIVGRYISFYADKMTYESCGYTLDGAFVESSTGEDLLCEILRDKTYHWYSVLNIVRRDYLLSGRLFFDETMACCEDAVWTPRVLFGASRVRYLEAPFYVYVQNREGSLTTAVKEKSYRAKMRACRFADDFAEKKKLSNQGVKMFRASYSTIYVSLLADSWCFDRADRKKYLHHLRGGGHFLRYSHKRYQRILFWLGKFIGIRGISYILHMRAQWVRKKREFC